jgi:hypothetical protein
MGERDEVWQHGENLFPGFKCMYCLKEFRGGGATRLKEHLVGKGENISRCNKCPPDIRNYLRELQRIRERKKGFIECKARYPVSSLHFLLLTCIPFV